MSERTPLSEKMHRLADSGHDFADDLRAAADDFDAKTVGYYGEPQTCTAKSFLGAFARARKLWCKATGEPLV